MTARFAQRGALAGLMTAIVLVSGCGDLSQGRAPAEVVVVSLEVASGATPSQFSGTLFSDVITDGTVYADLGRVTMQLRLKDPGAPGASTAPSTLNSVTINRYRVRYRRTDGRDEQGVAVPYTFDSALTFTVAGNVIASPAFPIVRHTAKAEAPLKALAAAGEILSTIAEVTFYGADLAGNDVVVSAQVGIDFGNFADPS